MKKIVFLTAFLFLGFFVFARTPEINCFFIEYKKLIKAAENTVSLQVYSEFSKIEEKHSELEENCVKLMSSKGWEQSDTDELNELRQLYADATFQIKLFSRNKKINRSSAKRY